MNPTKHLAAAISVIAIAACQSTAPSPPPPPTTPASLPAAGSVEIWQTDADGSLVHLQSGAVCSNAIGDMVRVRQMVFSADGIDVACHYEANDGAILTRYFTYLPEMNAVDHANSAVASATQVKGLSLDVETSEKCSLAMTLTNAIASAEQTTATDGDTPCRILTGGGLRSLVAVQVKNGWHDKLRITQEGNDESDFGPLIAKAIQAYRPDLAQETTR